MKVRSKIFQFNSGGVSERSYLNTSPIKSESINHNILKNTYKTRAEISDIKEYTGNEIVSFEKDIKNLGIKSGDLFKIEKINNSKGTNFSTRGSIDLVRMGDNKKINWNPSKSNEFISIYEEKSINLAEGEKIKWTKNSKENSFVINGETASIEKIGKNKIKIKTENGKVHSISKSDMKFMDYGYAVSTYSSQGKTSDSVIGILRAKEKFVNLSHQRSFYVTVSRAAKEAHLVIDNYKELIKSLSNKTGDKTSAISHQSQFDKNTKIVKDNTQEKVTKERANLIKATFRQLVSEYENLEKLQSGKDSLSSMMKESVQDFKSSQSKVGQIYDNITKNSAYSNPNVVIKKWEELVKNHGLTKAQEIIENNYEKLGDLRGKKLLFFNDKNRKDAISKIKQTINLLTNYTAAKDTLKVNLSAGGGAAIQLKYIGKGMSY